MTSYNPFLVDSSCATILRLFMVCFWLLFLFSCIIKCKLSTVTLSEKDAPAASSCWPELVWESNRDLGQWWDHPFRILLCCQTCVAYYRLLLYCRWQTIKAVQRERKRAEGEARCAANRFRFTQEEAVRALGELHARSPKSAEWALHCYVCWYIFLSYQANCCLSVHHRETRSCAHSATPSPHPETWGVSTCKEHNPCLCSFQSIPPSWICLLPRRSSLVFLALSLSVARPGSAAAKPPRQLRLRLCQFFQEGGLNKWLSKRTVTNSDYGQLSPE